jgi:hypothetical protein
LQKAGFSERFCKSGGRKKKKNKKKQSGFDERRCHDGEKGQVYVHGRQGTDGYKNKLCDTVDITLRVG